MTYVSPNFKTKKKFKEAVAAGKKLMCFNPGMGPDLSKYTGRVVVSGPHSPEPHKWYATVELEDGYVKSVK